MALIIASTFAPCTLLEMKLQKTGESVDAGLRGEKKLSIIVAMQVIES